MPQHGFVTAACYQAFFNEVTAKITSIVPPNPSGAQS
jgi:hypothetical protein